MHSRILRSVQPPIANFPDNPAWPRALSLSRARVVCWRPHPAGTRQYLFQALKMNHAIIILIYFLAFLPSFLPYVTRSPAATNGPRGFLPMYITYILVSKSTPLAGTGPHGQLASIVIACGVQYSYRGSS